MALQFTKEEVERELADLMPHGSRHDIAKISGLGESHIKRQFNPDDETASCAFRILQVVCAFDEIDADKGEAFWQAISQFRELSKTRKPGSSIRCLNTETGRLGKEVSEFMTAKLTAQSYKTQMKELLDVERQIIEVKNALVKEFEALAVQIEM